MLKAARTGGGHGGITGLDQRKLNRYKAIFSGMEPDDSRAYDIVEKLCSEPSECAYMVRLMGEPGGWIGTTASWVISEAMENGADFSAHMSDIALAVLNGDSDIKCNLIQGLGYAAGNGFDVSAAVPALMVSLFDESDDAAEYAADAIWEAAGAGDPEASRHSFAIMLRFGRSDSCGTTDESWLADRAVSIFHQVLEKAQD
jgi:hypothetical protein